MKAKFVLPTLLFTFVIGSAVAQNITPLPIDTAIRYGKLSNGLTYYIRHNEEPKQRAEFYIAQNVGAILENDDQNGLAHFLEHMAFNGTKNFPGKGVINFLEHHGVKFGENINAYTNLDETVYNLSNVPVTEKSVIDSALLILHDWSSFISLEEKEIDSERGVIREEWRQRANADRRMYVESNKIKYAGSQYAKRDVIGDTAVVNNFKYKTLRDYYQKWYRPDLQAILVVGDVNVNEVEAQIKSTFADIPAPVHPAERTYYPIPDTKEPIISVVKDKEARMTRIGVEIKHDKLPDSIKLSMNGYVLGVVNQLITAMMSQRIEEISQQADAPFVGGYVSYGELVKTKDAFEMLVVPKEGQELDGMKALFSEVEKMKRYGFTNAELERAKTNMLNDVQNQYQNRKNRKNNNLVREYVRHFLSAEVIPGIEWEYNTLQMLLPQLKGENINQMAKSYVTDNNTIIYVMAPEKEGVVIPDNQLILNTLAEVKKSEITPKAEEDLNMPLIDKSPVAGKIKKTSEDNQFGTTTWVLDNGTKVVFKPTKFKEDQITMSAKSEGGIAYEKNLKNILTDNEADNIIPNNGLGKYSQVELSKALTGKIASVNPYISNYSEGFSGSSSVKDFETMLQLTYLYFTGVRQDDNAFKAMMNMYKASLANSAKDPRVAFSDSVSNTLSDHNPRNVRLNLKNIDQIDQLTAIEFFKSRFKSPGDFTFYFTGNINPNDPSVQRSVLTWLGGVKTKYKKEIFTDDNIRIPRGLVDNFFSKEMQVKKTTNYVVYSGFMKYNLQNQIILDATEAILDIRYMESIREKEGGTYGVSVWSSYSKKPIQRASLTMYFDTDPQKQSRLIKILHSEVDSIVANGPKIEDLQKVKENMLKKYEENLRENSWWSGAIRIYDEDKINLLSDYKKTVEDLTPQLIQNTLRKLSEQGNILQVVMKPAE